MSNDHEWLNLIEISGPFLAVPVLREIFPQGLEALTAGRPQRLRSTYDEWREAVDIDDLDLPSLHSAWIDEVLATALEMDGGVVRRETDVSERLTISMPEHGVTIAPDMTVVNPTNSEVPLLLIHVYEPDTDLDATRRVEGLAITPSDRMVTLLRGTACPVGLVTNGERWMLVYAPAGVVAGFASWYARLWTQEPETLRAFVSLLGIRRHFGPEVERLPALFERSSKYQDDVTEALGEQVRRAVEVIVQALDRADQDRNRDLLRDVAPRELYEAGLTIMMRLVFLLAAEERGLLLLGDPRYDTFYAVSSLRMQLRADSEEILERRRSSWTRLLALFRGVFGGIDHPTLRLPALGGSLFDPDRYPFLEGRKKETCWRTDPAEPLPIDDRTVLLLLEAIQTFDGRTLSYRALDVEQIGHVYEGLLERTVQRVDDVTLELEGSAKAKNARIALGEIESARLDGAATIVELLKERSERSEPAIRNAISREPDERLAARLLTVCRGDLALRDRILPYAELLRTDPWGYPLVHHADAFVVVLGADRRESGTHYTPKSLTEKIVEETLTPIVYRGPAEGAEREDWKLKSADELLDLKVCDPAMGSGAFLVQACRWLADRLVEAWFDMEAAGGRIDDEGRVRAADDTTGFEPLSRDTEERAILARRLVAERCLYGVDKNPLAVELAKLSLWLTTLAKGRPFGFLDHNLRSGDSLLGIHDLGQLIELDMKPKAKAQLRLFGRTIRSAIDKALALRSQLRLIPIRDIGDVEAMAALDAQSRHELVLPELIADALIGIVLTGERAVSISALATTADEAAGGDKNAQARLLRQATADLARDTSDGDPRRPLHWPLEFPEVFQRENSGFDSVVGNPPFITGKRISTNSSEQYQKYLKYTFENSKGAADICVYFIRKGFDLSRDGSQIGMICTKSVAEGDSRIVGLEYLKLQGATIYWANHELPWPGRANVNVSLIALRKGHWSSSVYLNGNNVAEITSRLTTESGSSAHTLYRNKGLCSDGIKIQGDGFIISQQERDSLISQDERNSTVMSPYITGIDITQGVGGQPSAWIINFGRMNQVDAMAYKEAFSVLEARVKPYRDSLTGQIHEKSFWKFWDKRENFFDGMQHSKKILACPSTSKYLIMTFIDRAWVPSHSIKLFSFDDFQNFSIMQSSIHEIWARFQSGKLDQRLAYNLTKAFGTFPWPKERPQGAIGRRLYDFRARVSAEKDLCLTDLYNMIHNLDNSDQDIRNLRELIEENDRDVLNSFGWSDILLEHDFHQVPYLSEKDNVRFTISERSRIEILHRLSRLNSQIHRQEIESAILEANGKAKPGKKRTNREAGDLFSADTAGMETVHD